MGASRHHFRPAFAPVRLAAAVGLVFSALAILAGTRVLSGLDVPDYPVLPWLVQYKLAAGVVGR